MPANLLANLQGYLGAVSLKLLGGKLAPKAVYFIMRKELLNLSEMAPLDYKHVAFYYAVMFCRVFQGLL